MGAPLGCGGDDAVPSDGSESSSDGSSSTGGTTLSTTLESSGEETIAPDSSGSSDSSSTGTPTTDTGESSSGSESSSGAPESSSSSAGESSESGIIPMMCPAGVLGPELPDVVFGNTFGEDDDFSGSCGANGAPDVGITFTAPAAGTYTFDTHGSQLDTVIYALDGECSGTELACNDDGDGSQSVVELDLAADQTITIVVDGNDAVGGPFNLRVQEGSFGCPFQDIGNTVPNQVVADSSFAFNSSSGSCGGAGGSDLSFLFTAPNDGTFTFDTFGSSFASRIYIRDGVCGGAELACGHEGALATLTAGQQVTVYVDSPFSGGAFTLNVDTLGGVCPDANVGNAIPQTISDDSTGHDNTTFGSCGGEFSADDLFLFTAPQDGLYQFDSFGSGFDTIVYVREDGCSGAEIDCSDDYAPDSEESRVVHGMFAGEQVMVGIDGNGVGAYDLNIGLVPCPDEPIVGALPQVIANSTAAGIDKLHGSCGSGLDDESPDYAYSFTAPADGSYAFDTNGSLFDTRLYVLDGAACNGNEIACSDNYQFNWFSALSVQMTQNETVTVVVDGNFEQEGNFTLNVQALDGVCPDEDLGNTIPQTINGSTMGEDNAIAGTCAGLTGPDYSYTWTAPADGDYVFNTQGSAYDASVHVRDGGCGGAELSCASSFFSNGTLVFANLVADQTVVITVDGDNTFGAAEGDFQLVIDEAPAGGNCCVPHMETGCDVPEIQDCVCAIDSFCCDTQWDSICADEASSDCGAACF